MDPLKSPPGDPAHDFSRGAAVSKYTRGDPERSVESDIREEQIMDWIAFIVRCWMIVISRYTSSSKRS